MAVFAIVLALVLLLPALLPLMLVMLLIAYTMGDDPTTPSSPIARSNVVPTNGKVGTRN